MWSVISIFILCVCVWVIQRFGNMAGIFQVMAFGVRAIDSNDVDPPFMAKLAKIATAEMISSKVRVYCSILVCVDEKALLYYFGWFLIVSISFLRRLI